MMNGQGKDTIELSRVCPKVPLISLGDWTADSSVQEKANALGKDKFG
jgi:hypothetical protein